MSEMPAVMGPCSCGGYGVILGGPGRPCHEPLARESLTRQLNRLLGRGCDLTRERAPVAPFVKQEEMQAFAGDWATALDKVRQLEAALCWALREMEDAASGAPDPNGTPAHRCEFYTNPEKGACDFHDGYWNARELLGELEPAGAAHELFTPRVNGEPFRCDCGANVFRLPRPGHYVCNACGAQFAGDVA